MNLFIEDTYGFGWLAVRDSGFVVRSRALRSDMMHGVHSIVFVVQGFKCFSTSYKREVEESVRV